MVGVVGVVGVAAVAACHSAARPDDFVPFVDASAVDASCGDRALDPITATGSTPAGSLADYRYAWMYYDCGGQYVIVLSHTVGGWYCSADRYMRISFDFPKDAMQSGSGSFPAMAYEADRSVPTLVVASTTQITFEATLVDPPPWTTPSHLVGRYVASTSDWSLDLPVDLYAASGVGGCTL